MTKFSDLKLDPKVLKAIAEAGYEDPTPIQAGAIPHALEGRDVLGIAQTGTGKTASFTLPMITLLGRGRARARMPRSLVLCPTRELAAQVAENFDTYAKHTKLTKALLIGGVSFGEQDKLIDRGVDVLIATPGRLLDHFERGKLLLTGVQIMVVDEADRMLDMGFIPDIERIFQLTPFTRQTLFFSATMAPEIERITNTFLHSPERIEVARQATASETITQKLVEIRPARRDQNAKQKRELLRALIAAEGDSLKNAIIFCNRKTEVDIVAKSLKKHGLDAAPIHGDLDQSQRTRTLDGFREGTLRFLIASDVAARGLDIPAVSHIFNFDLPSHAEDYVHRIGRTGRAGRQGIAYSLSTPSDEKYLQAIENLLKQSLPRVDVPQGFSPSEGGDDRGESRGESRGDGRRGGREERRGRGRGGRREDRAEAEPKDTGKDAASDVSDKAPAQAQAAVSERDQSVGASSDRTSERRNDRGEDRGEARGSRERGTERGQDRTERDRADRERGDRERGERDRNERNRGGRDRRDGGRDGSRERVLGMGDHVPEFLRNSFRPQIAAVASDDSDAGQADEIVTDAAAETAVQSDAKPDKPARGRGRRKSPAKPEVAETVAETPTQPSEQATPAAASAETTSAEPEAETAPKPRRARRKKAESSETEQGTSDSKTAGDTAAEEQPKPRRARRKKADAEAATPAEPASEAATEAAPKPRRTRRKKADTDAPAEG